MPMLAGRARRHASRALLVGAFACLLLPPFGRAAAVALHASFTLPDSRFLISARLLPPPSGLPLGVVHLAKPAGLITSTGSSADTGVDMFLHRNYTVFACLWSRADKHDVEKVLVFRDLRNWLRERGVALRVETEDEADDSAWFLSELV